MARRLLQPVMHGRAAWLSCGSRHSAGHTRLVLGIETSCDDTGAAVLDETGRVLGEALHSQKEIHMKWNNSSRSTTASQRKHPASSRGSAQRQWSFFLLLSGGHCILAVARGVSDFLLLGQTIDIAPGDMLDKVARRLSLVKHPECHGMAGGKAIEHLAQNGDRQQYTFRLPMQQYRNCDFSFSGLQSLVNRAIFQKEKEEGIQEGEILSCVKDIAAAVQHVVAAHIIQRTHRAMLFCLKNSILLPKSATLVVSGGVASNQYIRKGLQALAHANGFAFLSPPPRLCTDNGVMIAWNGIERLRAGCGVLYSTDGIRYEPKAPLGIDISKRVEEDSIKVPRLRKIQWSAR
ncbi:probable tRNA N6-adenosine threonylcarbamoyltransferase, mitochondrial isoform X5 [Coturnix japonica]|uniref:probable tRNA N6-adenosine threonylcarbamoyltransferase, mitochondrial isoform X5 n=1 Tax=Coturnix japonica TaxID=93934 RepID=UPI000777290C|nr:probable tRNA N6-adenosine threonylcarbamoyltransferase, mitochondrial isoform X5 [Coturnix japonica]